MAEPSTVLVAALLRALAVGHRSHRAGLLRLLAGFDDATLTAEPARVGLTSLLVGDEPALARGVGDLVSARGLAPFAPVLLDLLRRDDRRDDAERWLRRAPYPRPTAPLVRLAVDPKADLRARAAALRLLRVEGATLTDRDHALLLVTLAHGELHAPALRILEPVASESLVVAAAATNLAYGRALTRRRREERTGSPDPSWFQALLSRWSPDHDALGVDRRFKAEQRDFVHAIARLAVAAHSQRYLERLLPFAFEPGFTPLLERAWVEQGIDTIAGPLLAWLGRPFSRSEGWTTRRRAIALRLLGHLATAEAIPAVERHLPAVGALADQDGQAAIVALARLRARTKQAALPPGSKAQLALLLDGALAFVRRALGQQVGEATSGAPGHASTVAASFEAGAALGDERFARAALDVLAGARDVPELGDALAPALVRLAPLELEPALERVLGAPDARASARAAAVDVVERARLVRLAPAIVQAARHDAAVADRAARALTALLGPAPSVVGDDAARHVEALATAPGVTDKTLEALLARATAPEVLPADAARALGRVVLASGGGGSRTRARALALVRTEPDRSALLALTVRLLSSPHGDVRTVALELWLELRATPADAPTIEPAWRALAQLVAQALAAHDKEPWARKQTSLALDAHLPRAGVPGLTRDAAEDLRQRLRQAGAWTSAATFHAAHRRLLELAAAGVDVGLLHGGLLELLGRATVNPPKTATPGPYEGPLPRLDETRRSASPFVQEALWDLVARGGYRRTLRLTLSFLESPRPRVRADVLGVVPRDGALAHEVEVLARLDDPAPAVREAAVQLLARHELARFAPALRPRLADPSDRVKLAAARTLARWGDRGGLELVATFLGSDDEALRREAVAHLRRFEPTDLRGLLAGYVALDRPRAAAAALAALRPDRGVPDDPALHAAVFALAARGRGPLRAAALALLPEVTDAPRLAEVVPLLADADPTVRAAAGQVLRRLDGRPQAPAVAQLAAQSTDGQVRRELLGLLVDLDVPAATKGLLPLLLDHDLQVRRAALALAGSLRGPSLRPDLEALLRRGLDVAAPPEALRDLVLLLDRAGGDDAAPALVDALRCEERGVWEAVLEAARVHGSDAHGGKVVELLKAKRPLAPPLLTLALGEAARLHRSDVREEVAVTAREHPNETVRRRALETLATLDPTAARALALEEAKAGDARLAALEKRPEAKDTKRTKALRVERARIVGTARAAGRVALRLASSARALDDVVRALPEVALQATVPGLALARVADAVVRGDAGAELARLPDRRERLAWRLRDRLAPTAWVARHADLAAAQKTKPAVEPALLLARARAGEPLDARALVARVKQAGDRPVEGQRAEELAIGLASAWQPERLPEVLEPLVAGAVARARATPQDRWGGKARAVSATLDHWAAKKLVLGRLEGTTSLVELGPELPQDSNGDGLARLLAAEGDLERLLAELARRPDKDRLRLLPLVGEVGGAPAVKALSTLGATDAPVAFREGAAKALALTASTGGAPAGASALAGRLLQDADPGVLAAALQAVERLGLGDHADVVVRLLGHASPAVQKAAADAAGALRLARARDALLTLVRGAPSNEPTPTSGATLVLEDVGAQKLAVIKAVRELCGLGLAEAMRLVETPGAVLQSGLTPWDADQKRLHLASAGARVVVRQGAQASAGSSADSAPDAVRDAAARALEALPQTVLVEGDPTALVEALRGRKTDRLVERLAHVLERVVGGERLDTVVGALLGEAADGPQVAALRVLGRRGHRAAAPAVRALLSSKSKDVRAAAAAAAGELGDQEALGALRHALTQDGAHEVRAAALRAVCSLLRRAGDPVGAAQLALGHVAEGHVEDARAAAKLLAEHPAPDALSAEAARALLARLLADVAPALSLPDEDEPPAALGARARGAVKNPLHPGRIGDVVGALAAQGVAARTRQAAHLLLSVGSLNVDAAILAALRPCFAALGDEPWVADLQALARARTTSAEGLRWALRLLVEVDPRAAAAEVVQESRVANTSRLRHGPARRESLAILGLAERLEPGAWAPWLRVALFDTFYDARRTARAGLQPGRFASYLTVNEDAQVDA